MPWGLFIQPSVILKGQAMGDSKAVLLKAVAEAEALAVYNKAMAEAKKNKRK